MKKSYPYLDVAKFIMSFFIVMLHTFALDTSSESDKVLSFILFCAVPFYFIISGFLMVQGVNFSSKEEVEARILKSIKRTAKLYFIWTIIYMPISIYFSDFNENPVKSILYILRGVFIVGQNKYSYQLWYLLSMLYALIFLYIVIHFLKWKKTLIYLSAFISLILLQAFNILSTLKTTNSVLLIMQKIILTSIGNGRILTGLFYIVIGLMIAEYQQQIEKFFHKQKKLLLILISTLTFCLYVFSDFRSKTFFLPFVVVPIVIMCLKSCNTNYPIFVKIRKCSTIIYFTHMIWFVLYTGLILKDVGHRSLESFIITSCISLLSGIIFVIIDYKGKISKSLL